MNDLSNFISSVGFPIVVSVAMFYQNNTLSANYQKIADQMEQKLDINTQVITRLIDKLDEDNILKEKSDTKND